MSTLRTECSSTNFTQEKIYEVKHHCAWYADLTGTDAEIIIRGQPDMTYLLRQGEREDHFYLTYVKNECEFAHIPFTVNSTIRQWFYRNYCCRFAPTLDLFIPEIMHVDAVDCKPLVSLDKM